MRSRIFLALTLGLGTGLLASPLFGQSGQVRQGPVDPELLGVWKLIDSTATEEVAEQWIEITEQHWSVVSDGKLQFRSPVIGQAGNEVVISLFCNRQARRVLRRQHPDLGETITVNFTETRTRFNPEPRLIGERYVRDAERPAAFDLAPVPLGEPRSLPFERVEEIREELRRRAEEDQSVREVFATPGARPSAAQQQEMMAVDEANTQWLLARIAELGWIDTARFGRQAAADAWLIVQHTQDLPLKWTVLQWLEEHGVTDPDFALLWDRTQIWLGRPQRYGSQLFYGPEGMFVAPLEAYETVDQRRAEVGLEPLADYLERFLDRNERSVIPIRTEF